jgi:hypothetical protein
LFHVCIFSCVSLEHYGSLWPCSFGCYGILHFTSNYFIESSLIIIWIFEHRRLNWSLWNKKKKKKF